MAINSTDANYVNISSLPKSQVAADLDLIILQTDAGTKTIEFNNFNVVRTDAEGNATVVGNLTGNDVNLENGLFSSSVSSVNFFSQGRQGVNGLSNYYNRFTINGGLVTSATYVTNNSPDYRAITQTILPNLTSWLNTTYKIYIDTSVQNLQITIPNGQSINNSCTVPSIFAQYPNLNVSDFQPYHFILTVSQRISSIPWISNFSRVGNDLKFTMNLGYNTPSDITILYRMMYPLKSNQYPF
jgi:hypothetical protein